MTMVFPFWYTGEAVFYKSDEVNATEIIKDIVVNHKGESADDGLFIFKGNAGLFGLHSFIKLKFDTRGTTVHVNFFTSLFESNILLALGLVLGSFLFLNDIFLLSSLFYVLGMLAYFGNTIWLNNYAKKIISPLGSLLRNVEEQELWEKQQLWMKNPDVCSACGEPVNPYATKCVNCDLQFSKKGKNIKHSSVSNTANANINFNIDKNKK